MMQLDLYFWLASSFLYLLDGVAMALVTTDAILVTFALGMLYMFEAYVVVRTYDVPMVTASWRRAHEAVRTGSPAVRERLAHVAEVADEQASLMSDEEELPPVAETLHTLMRRHRDRQSRLLLLFGAILVAHHAVILLTAIFLLPNPMLPPAARTTFIVMCSLAMASKAIVCGRIVYRVVRAKRALHTVTTLT